MKNHPLASLGILVVVLMALAAPASADGEGNILRVGPGQEYETIQYAVDAAQQGSRILVYPRIGEDPEEYEESVTITTNNLQIIAQDEDGVVTVSPPETMPGFDVSADHVTVRGFDISGVRIAPGIRFQGSHNTFAENMIHFVPSDFDIIAAIYCAAADGGSDYNTIENNSISGWALSSIGIGIYIMSSDGLNEGNVIRNNTIVDVQGPGILVNNGTGFEISGNLFENIFNHGCILVEAMNNEPQGHHRILKNTMRHCGGEYGGIMLRAYPGTVLAYNRVVDNWVEYCDVDCFALEADEGAALTHNQVMSNTFGMSYANGIHLSAGQDAAVNDNLIIDNLVYGNLLDGISLTTGSDHNRILNNEVQTNHEFGVAVAGDNNLIVGNWIWNNGYLYADTGVGNRWRNNNYLNP